MSCAGAGHCAGGAVCRRYLPRSRAAAATAAELGGRILALLQALPLLQELLDCFAGYLQ